MDLIYIISALVLVYTIYGVIWRLYLSPIAHIPGPKLAALTRLYEGYYDLVLGGQYTFKIIELHKQYGPIIRISPWELHIYDPEFYRKIYLPSSAKRRVNKYPWFTKFMGIDQCVFMTPDHNLHKMRREALQPYFSTANVRRLQPVIQERIDVMLRRIRQFQDSGNPLNAGRMYAALTNDVVSKYSFGRCYSRLEDPDFDPSGRDAAMAGATSGKFLKFLPWINDLLKSVPESVAFAVLPAMASFVAQQRDCRAQVTDIITGKNQEWRGNDHPTIFHSILDSKLPEEEKSIDRMTDDAQMMVMAGTLTTALTLELITFWLLTQPETMRKLKVELTEAIPDLQRFDEVKLADIEKLPYLTGVVKEGLRLRYGAATRLARIHPDDPIVFMDKQTGKEWIIPPGTPVGSTSVQLHHNETNFPQSREYRPERWLDAAGKDLDKYLVGYGYGTRNCMCLTLASAELYLAVASIFRMWGSGGPNGFKGSDDLGVLNLWETCRRDVEMESDHLLPLAQKGSKGVQLMVSS